MYTLTSSMSRRLLSIEGCAAQDRRRLLAVNAYHLDQSGCYLSDARIVPELRLAVRWKRPVRWPELRHLVLHAGGEAATPPDLHQHASAFPKTTHFPNAMELSPP